jgi:hypothetical protein
MLDEHSEAAAKCDPVATDVLAREMACSGATAEAEVASRDADEAGSTAASFNLEELMRAPRGGRAIAAFRRAVRPGHVAPGFSLGARVAEDADARSLITAYRVAAKCGDRGDAYQLGLLYLDRGDLESARSAFARADELGHAWAALALGEILRRTGDRSGAIAAHRRAADRGVAAASACLEALLEYGDADESIAASRPSGRAAASGPAKRAARKRLAWTAGTVAALGASLIVSLLVVLPTAGTRPAPRAHATHAIGGPKAPPTRAASGGVVSHPRQGGGRPPVHSPTAAPSTQAASGDVGSHPRQGGGRPAVHSPPVDFTAKQSALLDSVPGASHAQCLPRAQERLPGAHGSIRCFSLSAGVTAGYYRYSSRRLLRRVFHNYRAWFAGRQKLRGCAGATYGKYYQGSNESTITGRWACFYNDRTVPGSACIDWVDYGLLIFGSACQADGNFTTLAHWWRHAGPVPASNRSLTNRDS